MTRKVKSVSFNLCDPFENELYEYTQKFPNFSNLIKRLIQNSINGKSENVQFTKPVQKVDKRNMEQVVINPEHLKQLI